MKRFLLLIAVVVAIVAGLSFYSRQSDKNLMGNNAYVIGGLFGLTGDASEWGEQEQQGALLAIKEINSNGGVKNKPLKIISEDTQNTSRQSVSAARKLVSIDQVDILMGPTWLDSYPGATKMVEESNKVLITPSAGITAVQNGSFQKNTFSTFYRSDLQAKSLGQYMSKQGYKKIGFVFQNDAYYMDFVSHLKEGLSSSDADVELIVEYVNYGDSGKASLLKMSSEKVDALAFGMYDEGAIANLRNQLPVLFENTDLYSNDLIEWHLYSDDYRGEYENAIFVTSRNNSDVFVQKFEKEYGTVPLNSASNAYDTVYIIADMLENIDEDESYSEYLRNNTFDTETFGQITFDALGGVVSEKQQYIIQRVVDGVPVVIK